MKTAAAVACRSFHPSSLIFHPSVFSGRGILGDRLLVGRLPLKQFVEVQILLPELFDDCESLFDDDTAGWLLLVATPGSEPGGRWFDSNPRNSIGSHPAG